MRRAGALLWQVSLPRALLEGWLACAILLIPLYPVVLETTPLARSLYLVLVPLLCAALAGLRGRLSQARPLVTSRSWGDWVRSAPVMPAPGGRSSLS